jgi:hypothetical protein
VIAVNPSHHKIAFEIQDIALRPSEVPSAQERKIARVPRQTSGHDLAGTILKKKWTNLSWEAVPGAVAYDVYLGESFEDVNNGVMETFQGNQSKTFLVVGFPGFPFPDGLVPGTTYYWRVDEINDSNQESPKKGSIRSFSIAPRAAYDPDPPNGAKSVDPDVRLGWQEGFGAKLHAVYFSDDLDTVTNASGRRPQAAITFNPRTLDLGNTYYWRVDEFDGATTHKGSVWSFTVMDGAKSQHLPD